MANFCKECSENMFGKDFKELSHNIEDMAVIDLCEGCGWIYIDKDGSRIKYCELNYVEDVCVLDEDGN